MLLFTISFVELLIAFLFSVNTKPPYLNSYILIDKLVPVMEQIASRAYFRSYHHVLIMELCVYHHSAVQIQLIETLFVLKSMLLRVMENPSQSNQAQLCRNGCGFYGNSKTDGMCSICYKDTLQKKNISGTTSPGIVFVDLCSKKPVTDIF